MNATIREKYNVSLEDYLPQIYAGAAPKVGKTKSLEEEILVIDFFLRSPAAASEVKPFMAESLPLHQTIIEDRSLPETPEDADRLVDTCKRSLALLTRGAMLSQSISPGTSASN